MADGVELGVGYVSVLPRTDKFAGEFRKQMSSAGGVDAAGQDVGRKFGGGLVAAVGKFAAPLAAAFSGVALTSFVKDSIAATSDLSESINAVQVSYGEASNGILNLSKTAAQGFGLSSSEFNGFAVQFQSFAKTIAGADGDVVGTFDSIIGRATDFASVMNLDVSEAATLFQSGLAGETEPLRRFGIDLSAASVQAYAYANGIGEAGTELTEAQKVQARYGSLLEQTAKTQGDFANTSDGLANRQRILGAEWENLKAKLGAAFVPAATAGLAWLSDEALPAIEWLSNEIGPAADMVREFFGGFDSGATAGGKMAEFATSVAQAWTSVTSIFTSGVTIVQNLWRLFGANIVGYLTSAFASVMQVVQGAFTFVQGIFNIFAGLLTGNWGQLWEGIKQVLSGAWAVITGLVEAAWNTVQFAFSNAGAILANIFGGIWAGIQNLAAAGAQGLVNLITGLPGRLLSLGGALLNAGKDLIGKFFEGLGTIGSIVVDLGKDIVNGIIGAMNTAISAVNDALPNSIGIGPASIDLPDNPIPKIPKLAKGGVVNRPTLAIIGEAGPEVVLPLSSPNAPDWVQNGPGAGSGVTQNNTFSAPLDEQTYAEIAFRKLQFAAAGTGGA